jgi:FAD binding domain/Berberine and berberine like
LAGCTTTVAPPPPGKRRAAVSAFSAVKLKVDVMVAGTTPVVLAARNASTTLSHDRDREGIMINESALQTFRASLRGQLVMPKDVDYDEARRIHNGMIDRRPAAIVRCAGVADVVSAVTFAREASLVVAVRGAGHNIAGTSLCDGGIVVDLSRMKGIRVDAARRTVRVEGGATWADLNHELQVSDSDANIRWTREFFDAMRPYLADEVYVNYLGDEGPDHVRAAYGAKYDQLVELKNKYDPTNFFQRDQNIRPSGRAA